MDLDTLKDAVKAGLEFILTPSPAVFVIGALVVLLVPVLLHFLLSSTSDSSLPFILLAGPPGAGKTALLTLFERGPRAKTDPATTASTLTHTSQVPATVELAVSEDAQSSFRDDLDASGATAKNFLAVDTPGHPKLRRHALARLGVSQAKGGSAAAAKLKGVVFVVDAAALADGDSLPATAEYLYDVLLNLQKRLSSNKTSRPPPGVPVLVAANKLDLFTALPAALVKSNLETELGRIRKARSKGLLDSGVGTDDDGLTGDASDDWLGEYGSEKFTFKQMLEFDIEVEVIGGNIVGEGPGVDKWWSWIAKKII
ncbi:P-loop containing nucleoside triphosphate hydrolase protein [Thozetella sp. PMI_491]|nr:P-loop containing nucleoside triphosphate hydrolase protein [Thozetella sp. PMI_491]